nr:hypothetical protein [Cedecea lapagei]
MLEDYFSLTTTDQDRRALAVQAALEIAKASVSAPSAFTGVKSSYDLQTVAAEINALADAIQAAIERHNEN